MQQGKSGGFMQKPMDHNQFKVITILINIKLSFKSDIQLSLISMILSLDMNSQVAAVRMRRICL